MKNKVTIAVSNSDTTTAESFMEYLNDIVAHTGAFRRITVSPNLYNLMLEFFIMNNSNTLSVLKGKIYYLGIKVKILTNTKGSVIIK